MKQTTEEGPVRLVVNERLDFNHFGPHAKTYLVASSYRSGSTYLCWRLWQTGLLGAPSEVLNPTSELPYFMNRLKATSPADYINKLLARRTSKNGIFGIKAHFHHFDAYVKAYPELLEVLSPITYIFTSRSDKVAQAVSMAKALQTDQWTSRMMRGSAQALQYNRQLIAKCLDDIEQQDRTWRRWFAAHNITPFEVTYDGLTADPAGVVRSIVRLLGVEDDEPDEVDVPPPRKQGDETNQEWITRFLREGRVGAIADAAPPGGPPRAASGAHFFDRYDGFIKGIPPGAASATGFLDVLNLRRRYDAIVARHGDLFRGARVLDIMSSYGFWSLAALDAGAAQVVGIESSPVAVAAAEKAFAECGVDAGSYRFTNSELFVGLRKFKPGAFDLILCQEYFEQCDSRRFFHQLDRLQPKQVILDTEIVIGEGPIVRFSLGMGHISGTPNHPLIMFLCNAYNFRWRLIDWRSMGITDWTGIHEYERDHRRTYIIDRAP